MDKVLSAANKGEAWPTVLTPEETKQAANATPQESPISWREVNSIYNLRSNKTDLQKDEEWKRFKGQRGVARSAATTPTIMVAAKFSAEED